MLKLTDLEGRPIYFNPEAIEIVRGMAGESPNANAAVVVSFCAEYVKETVEEIIKKLG